MPSTSLRILIADDDPELLFCLRAQLTHLGHEVIGEARDGEQAIMLARHHRPDLTVLDIKMPRLDGLQACSLIAQECPCAIVLLSAYSDPQLVHQASTLPIQGYLIKPVREQELGPAIELAIARFQETQRLQDRLAFLSEILDIRSLFRRATSCLVTEQHCSPQEAWSRIEQEARAKRVELDIVARAILQGQPVPYHHDVPI